MKHATWCISENSPKMPQRRFVVSAEEPIAFHAVADANQSHLGKGQNIVFETVLLNLGSGYHNQHGIFIAPVGGLYVFSVSILNQPLQSHEIIEAVLLKNGVKLAISLANGTPKTVDQGSITATTQLQDGDEVWVEVYYPGTDAFVYGNKFSSFTGFLLYSM